MNIRCQDRDRIFADGSTADWAALELHAGECRECAEELSAWNALSVAAQELRDYAPSPVLWQRIQQSLLNEAEQKRLIPEPWGWLSSWSGVSLGWQTVAAGLLVTALTISSGWFYLHPVSKKFPPDGRARLLQSAALAEVEKTESAYTQAIDKLAREASPQLNNLSTPLLSSYREKLLVLDSAISNLREQAGMNPSNAHLRRQLLAMYQEKQNTLEEVLEEKR